MTMRSAASLRDKPGPGKATKETYDWGMSVSGTGANSCVGLRHPGVVIDRTGEGGPVLRNCRGQCLLQIKKDDSGVRPDRARFDCRRERGKPVEIACRGERSDDFAQDVAQFGLSAG